MDVQQLMWLRGELPGQANSQIYGPEPPPVNRVEREPMNNGVVIFEHGFNYIVDENGTRIPDYADLSIDGKHIGNILDNKELGQKSPVYSADKRSFRKDVTYSIPGSGGKSRRKSRRKSRKSKKSRRRRY